MPSPHWEGLQHVPQVPLTCHGFQPHEATGQTGEVDPATAVAVAEAHETQQLIAHGDTCKEVWATGRASEQGGGRPWAWPSALRGLRTCSEGPVTRPARLGGRRLFLFSVYDSLIFSFLVAAGP